MAANPAGALFVFLPLIIIILLSSSPDLALSSHVDSPVPSPLPSSTAPPLGPPRSFISYSPAPSSSPSPNSPSSLDPLSPPLPTPTTPTPTPTPSPSPAPAPAPSGNDEVKEASGEAAAADAEGSGGGMSGGKKAGIAFGVLACVAVVGMGAFVCKKRRDNIRRSRYGYDARMMMEMV